MINLTNFAKAIVAQYFAVEKVAADKGIKTKAFAVEKAKMDGLLAAADRLQITAYGNGEVGVKIDLNDILREMGERPAYRVVNNSEQHDYDNRVAQALVARSFREGL